MKYKTNFPRTWQRPKIPVPEDKGDKKIFSAALGALLFSALASAVLWTKLPAQVPIFYSRPWGEEQLGRPIFLFLPLVLGFLFLVFNLLLSKTSQQFTKQVMLMGGATAAVLASITVLRIILLLL